MSDLGPPKPERYCLRCQERLINTASDPWNCLRCGWQFDPSLPDTFRTGRVFLRWKFWFPGFCLAVASGVLSYALILTSGELGWALFLAVPVSFGAILGYGTRTHVWAATLLGIVAIFSVVLSLVTLSFAGIFCGATLSIVFLLPTAFGAILGYGLRIALKHSAWDQRGFLPLVLMVVFPYACQLIELALPNRTEIATVRTELKVDATPEEAWNAIMFYEDVAHAPPWLLSLALPKPLGSEGDKSREGNVVRCYYDTGYLAKRISKRVEGRLLAFDVIEQHIKVEHDLALKDGSFEIVPTPDGKAIIRLVTRDEPKLKPRFVWRPFEERVIHTLHTHVLEGMKDQAEHVPVPLPDRPSSAPEERPLQPVL